MKTRMYILAQLLVMIIMGSVSVSRAQDEDRKHLYRAAVDGFWEDVHIWEISSDGVIWKREATQPPDSQSFSITIPYPRKVTIQMDLVVDELRVLGTLIVTANMTVVDGRGVDMMVGSAIPLTYGRLEHCGNINVEGAQVDAWWGSWQNHCTSQASASLSAVSAGSINNSGEIKMGTFIYGGGAVTGHPFIYDPNSTATLVLNQSADDTSMAVFWPSTNGPANITVTGNVTLNGMRTITGTLRLEGSSAGINNLGELLIEGTFVRGLGSGSVTGKPFRYGANGSLTITNYFNAMDVIDAGSLFWPGTNGPANVTIASNVTLNATRTVTGTLDVPIEFHVVGTLTTNGTTKVTGSLYVVGTLINNGTIQALSGGIEVSGKLTNIGRAELIWLTIKPGATFSGNDLAYVDSRSTLFFDSAYEITNNTIIWPRQNGPANVTVPSSISVTVNAPRSISNVLQIAGTLQVADTLTTNEVSGGGTLQVDGTLIANGRTNVWTLIVAGTATNHGTMENNRTCQVSGTLTNNGTITSYGEYQVSGALINNGTQSFYTCQVSGRLTNNGATHINFTFQLDQDGTASGNDFTYGGSGMLLFNNFSGAYDVSSESVYWPGTNGPANVTVHGAGGIKMNIARSVQQFETAAAVTNADSLKIFGTVILNAGGSFDSPPIYNGAPTLIYGAYGSYEVGMEWDEGTATGAGVPANVIIYNHATVNMPDSPRTCPGYLRNYGTLVLSATPEADLSIGGDWENEGTFLANSRAVIFNGTDEQNIRGSRENMFDYLTVNNPAGILVQGQEGNSEVDEKIEFATVQQALTFTAGNIRLRLGRLILSGQVSGAAIDRHVVTYEKGRVERAISGDSSFQFPVGPTETSYNPLTIALAPADSTETFSVHIDSAVALNDSLFVQRTWDIQEATPGDNHAALTFQWAAAEEGAKFMRNASFTYLDEAEIARNTVASGADPYFVSTPGFPCTEFSRFTVGTPGNVTGIAEQGSTIPTAFSLEQNYPNPFNPSTTLTFTVPRPSLVRLKVFNSAGSEVATLANGKYAAGIYHLSWNASRLASGFYFYRLEAEGFTATKRLLLMK